MLLPPIVTLGECTSTKPFMFDVPGSAYVKNVLFSLKQVWPLLALYLKTHGL